MMDDLEAICTRYMSAKNLNDIDIGALMTEITDLLNDHHIVVSAEYTMLIRSLVTMEGVIEKFCPELDLFTFLQEKLLARAKESIDVKETLTSSIESLASTATRTLKLPGLAYEALRNLVKGRLKVNLEPTGIEKTMHVVIDVIINVLLAIFACVLFSGSCQLAAAMIPPLVNGVPLFSIVGFAVAIALSIFSIQKLIKIARKL